MASMDFEFWRDFSLSVSLKNDERSETPSDSTPTAGQEEDPDCQVDIVKPGDVCQLLERVRNSRTSPKVFFKLDQNFCLHREKRAEMMPYRKPHGEGKSLADLLNSDQYSLTPKVKIMLSFAVARSFWEFYGSESTTTQWCSDNIWFMPREKANRKHTDALELKAFVGFPSGENFPGPNEFLDVDEVTHTYPRILCLGIILLEIGLGKNLGLLPFTASNNLEDVRNGVNDAHSDAGCQREELKNEIWDTCRNKFAFDDAISNCMNPNKFIESSKTREKRSRLSPDRYKNLSPHLKAIEDGKRAKYHALAMQDRREAIYKHVVSPLYWLATVGYDNGNNDVFIEPSKQQHGKDHRPTFAPEEADRAELKRLSKQLQNPTFNSGAHVKEDAERWFEDIRAISSLVFRRRRMGTKLPPLRIAILDTGCDTSLNCFRAAQCFKGWRDFAVEPPSQTEVDEYGHGTFMVRLVMQIVPGCELYIARIAKTTHQLEGNGKLIAEVSDIYTTRTHFTFAKQTSQAINHAGNDWEVDVISMSFGFPKFSQLISDAIANVRKIRKGAIVFLASAGNDVNRAEAYPACDPSVISIYATESNGAFLNTNPLSSRESLRVLGTYGDNVPEAVLAELRVRFPKGDFNAGTSIATAVAAGIAGLVLAYAAILPHVLRGIGVESLYSELKTTDGMRHMLFAMAKSWNDRQYFVNAISFWSYNLENSDMFRAICRALPQNEVMR
ncbi:hypothetical protein J4E81_007531 [Alternaria sp. BMP 2799]|nr:hypothetical protein J4E81_007531 [Alternaria sp. BMP 2799]